MSEMTPTPARNPYMVTLWVIAGAGLVLGVILLIAGATVNDNAGFGDSGTPGMGLILFGAGISGLGMFSLFAGLVASAIRWVAPTPAVAVADEDKS